MYDPTCRRFIFLHIIFTTYYTEYSLLTVYFRVRVYVMYLDNIIVTSPILTQCIWQFIDCRTCMLPNGTGTGVTC